MIMHNLWRLIRNILSISMYIFLFCSANALITDLPDFIPLIEMNITENKSLIKGSAKALPLRWGEDTVQDYFHYILLADCIYYEEVSFFSLTMLKFITKITSKRVAKNVHRFMQRT